MNRKARKRSLGGNKHWCVLTTSLTLLFQHICLAVDHSPKWTGTTSITYNLIDLEREHFYDGDEYGYCGWGNLMSFVDGPSLKFSLLTAPPYDNSTKDLFLSRSKDQLFGLKQPEGR